jgi:hypothetical protein
MPTSSRPSSGTRSRPGSAAAPPPAPVFIDKGPKYMRMLDEQRNPSAGKVKVSKEKVFDLIEATDEQLRARLRKLDGFLRGRMSFGLCMKSRKDLETLYFEHHPTGQIEWDFVCRERWRLARANAAEHEREAAVHEAEKEAEAAELALTESLEAEEAAEKAAALELAMEIAREEIETVRLIEAEEGKDKVVTGGRRRSFVQLLDLSLGGSSTVAAGGGGGGGGGIVPLMISSIDSTSSESLVSQLRIKINN